MSSNFAYSYFFCIMIEEVWKQSVCYEKSFQVAILWSKTTFHVMWVLMKLSMNFEVSIGESSGNGEYCNFNNEAIFWTTNVTVSKKRDLRVWNYDFWVDAYKGVEWCEMGNFSWKRFFNNNWKKAKKFEIFKSNFDIIIWIFLVTFKIRKMNFFQYHFWTNNFYRIEKKKKFDTNKFWAFSGFKSGTSRFAKNIFTCVWGF